jgi:hypothetical protein
MFPVHSVIDVPGCTEPEPQVGSWMVWLADFASPTPMTLAMMRETSAGV